MVSRNYLLKFVRLAADFRRFRYTVDFGFERILIVEYD